MDREVIAPGRSGLPAIPASTLLGVFRGLFVVWGVLSFIAAAAVGGFIAYKTGPGNQIRVDRASAKDVGHVLNWAGLGAGRIDKVVHSYQSSRSATGEYLDAYAIAVRQVSTAELSLAEDGSHRWYRGDQLPPVMAEAMRFAGTLLARPEIAWFPPLEELRSAEVFLFPWRVQFLAGQPQTVEFIFVRPSDRMVFFISAKK